MPQGGKKQTEAIRAECGVLSICLKSQRKNHPGLVCGLFDLSNHLEK